jgi:outer membrane biosynthesis protein TonB
VDVCTYAPISGTSLYKLAGSGISDAYTKSVSVLDVTRGEASNHIFAKDQAYTLPFLMSYGYASYNATVEEPEPEPEPEEEPEETTTTETPTEPSETTTEPTSPEPEAPQEPSAPDTGTPTEPAD